MADVKIVTRRGELAGPNSEDGHDQRRGIHTVYLADESSGQDDAGNYRKQRVVSFMKGRNDAVPAQLLEQQRAAGFCK